MTPDAVAAGLRPSAEACGACASIREKASAAAEQIWVMQLGMSVSIRSVGDATFAARRRELKCRCGIGSMAVGYDQAHGEKCAEQQGDADADHAGRPTETVEQ